MAVFDAERAWLRLKGVIVQKGSHGRTGLLTEMARIEVECSLEDTDRQFTESPVRLSRDRGAA